LNKYKTKLFGRVATQMSFKRELQQIVQGTTDEIDDRFELPNFDSQSILGGAAAVPGAQQTGASRLTHEELQIMIEQVLEESGYYRADDTPPHQPHQQHTQQMQLQAHAAQPERNKSLRDE
jgi:hypothetical protein